MAAIITYGLGGYCENCDESHDHPLNNLISIVEIEEDPGVVSDNVVQIAEALSQLPAETLNSIIQALGLQNGN